MAKIFATLGYLQKDNAFLLLHRNKKPNDYHQGKWIGPGGKVEPGETPAACVIREVYEETGLTIVPERCGEILFPLFDGQNDWHVYVFRSKQFSGNVITSEEGTLAWVDKADLFDLPMWEGDAIFLQWVIEDYPYFKAVFNYNNGQFMDYDVIFVDE